MIAVKPSKADLIRLRIAKTQEISIKFFLASLAIFAVTGIITSVMRGMVDHTTGFIGFVFPYVAASVPFFGTLTSYTFFLVLIIFAISPDDTDFPDIAPRKFFGFRIFK